MALFLGVLSKLISDAWAGSCSSILAPGVKIPMAEDEAFWKEPGIWIGTGVLLMALRYFFKRRKSHGDKK